MRLSDKRYRFKNLSKLRFVTPRFLTHDLTPPPFFILLHTLILTLS